MPPSHRSRPSTGRPAAIGPASALALLLALGACTTAAPETRPAASAETGDKLLQVADDTRAAGDPVTAAGLYRQVHEKQPNDPVPLLRLGAALAETRAYAEAAEAYRAVLALRPDDNDARRALALVLLAAERPEAALAELETALASHAGDPRLLNALGVAHEMLGRRDLAMADFRKGLAIAPGNPALLNNYGMALALGGDHAAAIATLAPLADRPEGAERHRLNLALAYGLAGDEKKAAATARLVLDERSVRNNLAFYALLRRLDDKSRTAAVVAAQLHGTALRPPASETAAAAPPETAAAPQIPVESAALPPADMAPQRASSPPSDPQPGQATAAPAPTGPGPASAPPAHDALLGALPPEDAPKTDIASAPGSAGRFTVQLGAFTLEATARKLARAFAAKGYAVSVTRVRERFAVRTGAFASADEAAAAIPQLKKVAAVQPLVLRRSATLAATAPSPGA